MIKVNMQQMSKWNFTEDNVRFYDNIMKNKGSVTSLDNRGYVYWLCEFNVFYTEK